MLEYPFAYVEKVVKIEKKLTGDFSFGLSLGWVFLSPVVSTTLSVSLTMVICSSRSLTKSCTRGGCGGRFSGGGGEGFLSSAVSRDGNTSESLEAEAELAIVAADSQLPLTAVQCPSPDLQLCSYQNIIC